MKRRFLVSAVCAAAIAICTGAAMSAQQDGSAAIPQLAFHPVDNFFHYPGHSVIGRISGVAVGPNGNIVALNRGYHPVLEFKSDGTFVGTWGEGSGMFEGAHQVRFDKSGNLWYVDAADDIIYRFDNEGRTMIAHYPDFVLCNIYFPNGKASPERLRYKMDYYEEFLRFVNDLRAKGRSVVICVDINTAHGEIDLARPRENMKRSGFLPEERDWMDRFVGSGFVDTFREQHPDEAKWSWWDMKTRARERNVGWRIDYFFVSQDLIPRVTGSFIEDQVTGSDHCPVGIEMD